MHALRLLALAAVLSLAASGQEEPGKAVETSYDAPDGTRVLRHEILVPASREAVWKVFTTAEGWKGALGIAFAQVDFRLGGLIETSYDPKAQPGLPTNIKNRILSYLPLRMLSIQAEQAPPGFPAPDLLPQLFSVIELAEAGEGLTRVTVSGVGYRKEERYEKVYRLFQTGNAWTLQRLRQHFAP
jgi:hypothetical protein